MLKTLDISKCRELETLPDLRKLKSLESLNLEHCCNLRALPDTSMLPHLKVIGTAGIAACDGIELFEASLRPRRKRPCCCCRIC